MTRVNIGDVELNVVDQGSGPPLLFVHGSPLDHSMWRSQLEVFQKSYRVIVPDLRGFGQSGATSGTVTMEQFANDLSALLDRLGVREPVVFCGLSLGGYIAWQFWRHHARQLRALVLCDTRSIADSEEAARGRFKMVEQLFADGTTWLADTMIPKLFAESTRRDKPDIVEATRRVISSSQPEGIAAALRGMAARPDFTDQLPQITLPALVVCGEHDAISPADEMRKIANSIPGARFELISQAGHMSPLENPSAFNAALDRFLRTTVAK